MHDLPHDDLTPSGMRAEGGADAFAARSGRTVRIVREPMFGAGDMAAALAAAAMIWGPLAAAAFWR